MTLNEFLGKAGDLFKANTDTTSAAALAEALAQAATLTTNLTAAQAKVTELETKITQAASDLATAKLSVASLTTERDALKATIADPKGEIATQAAKAALSIAAGQGITAPVAIVPDAKTGNADARAEASKLKGLAKFTALEKIDAEEKKSARN